MFCTHLKVTGGAAETPVTGQTGATYQITGLTSCTKYDIKVTPVMTKTSPAVTIPGESETKTEVWTGNKTKTRIIRFFQN